MLEGVVAAMDFLGGLSEKEKAELMKNASNSDGILKNQAGMNVDLTVSVAEEKYNNTLPSWIKTANGVAKRSVAECIPRPLDLSVVGSCSKSNNLIPDQSGFGSPIPFMGGLKHRTSSDDNQDGCLGPIASTIPGKQSRAQMTIFYGGTVNVYDDIPADKAQAIMLIASSGNYSSYPYTEVQKGCGSRITEPKTFLPLMKLSEGSRIHHQPASCNVYADFPIAKKHSLLRFLEKRKDRYRE